MKKFYLLSYITLTVSTAAAFIIALLASVSYGGTAVRVIEIAALVLFAAVQCACVVLYRGDGRSAVYRAGFALLHIGLLCYLGGALVFGLSGYSVTAVVPVGAGSYSEVQKSDGGVVSFGFAVAADGFETVTEADGSVVQYRAKLTFTDSVSAQKSSAVAEINRPVRNGGVKIYLLDGTDSSVTLLFKRDAGEFISAAGCVAVILGSAAMCLFGHKRKDGTV